METTIMIVNYKINKTPLIYLDNTTNLDFDAVVNF